MSALRFSVPVFALVVLVAPLGLVVAFIAARCLVLARRAIWRRAQWWYMRRLVNAVVAGKVPHHVALAVWINRRRRLRHDLAAMRKWDKAAAAVDLQAWQASLPKETSQPIDPAGR